MNSTFENPHQYSIGVRDVFVNGKQVLKNGEHTGVKTRKSIVGPGRVGGNWNKLNQTLLLICVEGANGARYTTLLIPIHRIRRLHRLK